MIVSFEVYGEPIAQPRAKVSTLGGKPRSYVKADHPVHAYRKAIELAARIAFRGVQKHFGAVRVRIEFVASRPKGLTFKSKPIGRQPDIRKPDIDNLCKAVLDALTGVAWKDDSWVVELTATKQMAATGEKPFTRIVLEW